MALPFPDGLLSFEVPDSAGSEEPDELFWSYRGAGKFCFLSTASTSLLNRLNRDSARVRVASRSMVFESSLTG